MGFQISRNAESGGLAGRLLFWGWKDKLLLMEIASPAPLSKQKSTSRAVTSNSKPVRRKKFDCKSIATHLINSSLLHPASPTQPQMKNHNSIIKSVHILSSIQVTAPPLHCSFHPFESQFPDEGKEKKTEIEESVGVNVVGKCRVAVEHTCAVGILLSRVCWKEEKSAI